MQPVVEAIGLHRTYRTTTGAFRRRSLEVEAVRGVSFEIAEGELFGPLGPNGAGKTTTIKMLITLLLPTSGSARVLGRDVDMFEADALCDRIAVVAKGRIVAAGTPRDLRAQVADGTAVEIEAYGIDAATVAGLRAVDGVSAVAVEDREQAQVVVVQAVAGAEPTQAILARLGGVAIGRVTTREPTLENAYVALVTERRAAGRDSRCSARHAGAQGLTVTRGSRQ